MSGMMLISVAKFNSLNCSDGPSNDICNEIYHTSTSHYHFLLRSSIIIGKHFKKVCDWHMNDADQAAAKGQK